MNVREDLQELAAGYALGSLNEADRALFETLLASGQHPELSEMVAEFQAAAALMATAAPAAAPSAALKARVMAAFAAEPAIAAAEAGDEPRGEARAKILELKPRRGPMWLHLGWGAAVAASLIAALVSWNQTVKLERDLTERRGQIADLQSRLEEERRWAAMMTAPGTREASLEMTGEGVAAMRGRALYDPRTRSAVIAFENVEVPSGKDLELWTLHPSGVRSMGLLRPGPDGRATMRLADAGDPALLVGFAVTLEKPGGSGNKTAAGGPIVMVGKLPS